MDLTHLNLVMSTLAQFHAVSFAWKQSLGDDSILDMYPFLSKPPCPNIPQGDVLAFVVYIMYLTFYQREELSC